MTLCHTPTNSVQRFVLGCVLSLLLSGCAHQVQVSEQQQSIARDIETSRELSPNDAMGLIPDSGYYLSEGRVAYRQPAILQKRIGAPGLRTLDKASVIEFAAHLSQHLDYPIDLAGDVYQPRESTSGQQQGQTQVTDSTGTAVMMAPLGELTQRYELPRITYDIAPQERVKDTLSRVLNQYGLSWRHDNDTDRLEIYRYESLIYLLPTLNAARASEVDLADGRAKASYQSSQDPRASILAAVETLLSGEGRAQVSDAGLLVVSDLPSNVAHIARYVSAEARQMTRQVVISTRLYTFTDSREDQYGLDWDAVYSGSYSEVTLTGTPSGVIGGVNSAMTIVSPTSQYTGTNLNLDALLRASGISVLYESDLVTLSGYAVPTNTINNTVYLKSVKGGQTSNSDFITTTLEPGEVTTGLSLWYEPKIVDNDIVLGMAFSLTSLLALSEEVSGENRITAPETEVRDGAQVVRLKNGGAIALSGFQVNVAENDDSGVGHPQFKLLGGAHRSAHETRQAVLVVAVRIVE